ncbi:bacillithiol biosynthesis cysteine-adding enzyme BshC [Desmospora profundinema]|uniref:Putative cysteine ligase BshC n=1 Tax=Desmospora profundinema TaxID=1571184 RepID=A0ABU1IJU8_9BACL|nr:bacillithiol biosynthesis cysteine-adding enzyme BshC [Desmospora profundinema]MDR6224812.1 bacillithiol biosynthesis cysteine-adding enzyme BshC [Desmospora profundinema]
MMRIEDSFLEPQDKLNWRYLHTFDHVAHHYPYNPGDDASFQARADRLHFHERVSRHRLVEVLRRYHGEDLIHPAVEANLERLTQEDSLVVIGGQQAGWLTGPLYTLYKAVTVLQLADREQQRLNRPVIPVFWIAGEDHDWDEVNHVYLPSPTGVERIPFPLEVSGRRSVGTIRPGEERLAQGVEAVIRHLPDTEHKPALLEALLDSTRGADGFSRHFARLMHRWFGPRGLLLVDSSDPSLRSLEVPFFRWLLKNGTRVGEVVRERALALEREKMAPKVDLQPGKAHLFVEVDGERHALYRDEAGFYSREGMRWSSDEMDRLLDERPQVFSNNVITRPLMQEWLFPTLATVVGPGEVAYWGLLKGAFETAGMEMPILYPRIQATLIGRREEKWLRRYRMTLDDVHKRWQETFARRLSHRYGWDPDDSFGRLRRQLEDAYRPLIGELAGLRPDLAALGESSLKRALEGADALEQASRQALREKDRAEEGRFHHLRTHLFPGGRPQERVFNPVAYWNAYGESWIHFLLNTPLLSIRTHRMIYL